MTERKDGAINWKVLDENKENKMNNRLRGLSIEKELLREI